jgi:hypothetical protein
MSTAAAGDEAAAANAKKIWSCPLCSKSFINLGK